MNDIYNFRKRMRGFLGRTILFPSDIEIYSSDIMEMLQRDKQMTYQYLKNCTNNELKALKPFLKELKENDEKLAQLIVAINQKYSQLKLNEIL